jgi:hypothetical protein
VRTRAEQAEDVEYPTDIERPVTRGDCEQEEGPCPWVSCEYHLYLDVINDGTLKLNFPDREVWELEETCALSVADKGGATLEEVGLHLNITRERVRQMEVMACMQVAQAAGAFNDETELEDPPETGAVYELHVLPTGSRRM